MREYGSIKVKKYNYIKYQKFVITYLLKNELNINLSMDILVSYHKELI